MVRQTYYYPWYNKGYLDCRSPCGCTQINNVSTQQQQKDKSDFLFVVGSFYLSGSFFSSILCHNYPIVGGEDGASLESKRALSQSG